MLRKLRITIALSFEIEFSYLFKKDCLQLVYSIAEIEE